jgi:hypothetical protein
MTLYNPGLPEMAIMPFKLNFILLMISKGNKNKNLPKEINKVINTNYQ